MIFQRPAHIWAKEGSSEPRTLTRLITSLFSPQIFISFKVLFDITWSLVVYVSISWARKRSTYNLARSQLLCARGNRGTTTLASPHHISSLPTAIRVATSLIGSTTLVLRILPMRCPESHYPEPADSFKRMTYLSEPAPESDLENRPAHLKGTGRRHCTRKPREQYP